ncbi:MAG: hypothetical protein RL199_1040 [Pseudomonadota bacterium]|jgi:hypothetical protein
MEVVRVLRRQPRWPWRLLAGLLGLAVAVLFVGHVWRPSQARVERAHVRRLVEELRGVRAEVESSEDVLEKPGTRAVREALIARIEDGGRRMRRVREELAVRPGGSEALAQAGLVPDDVEAALQALVRSLGDDVEPLPRALVRQVRTQLEGWRRQGVPRAVHERARRVWPAVARGFAEERVPEAFGWVAWQESAFDPEVCSPAGARGLWQLMPSTARRLRLRVDDAFDDCPPAEGTRRCACEGVDERVDPLKASQAGARYLAGLLEAFRPGGALMALAAYHRGEDGLRRALRVLEVPEERRSDFAYLVRMSHLPLETREYVPRVLAAMLVGTRPELFGLSKP